MTAACFASQSFIFRGLRVFFTRNCELTGLLAIKAVPSTQAHLSRRRLSTRSLCELHTALVRETTPCLTIFQRVNSVFERRFQQTWHKRTMLCGGEFRTVNGDAVLYLKTVQLLDQPTNVDAT